MTTTKKAWVVEFKNDPIELKIHLGNGDADKCMIGEQCVGLGIEVARLRANIGHLREDTQAPVCNWLRALLFKFPL